MAGVPAPRGSRAARRVVRGASRRPGSWSDNRGSLSSFPEFLEGEACSLCTSSSSGQKDVSQNLEICIFYTNLNIFFEK